MSLASDILDLYEMANFRKKSTGLPRVIFVSSKGGVKHGPRIKVSIKKSDNLNPEYLAISVSIEDEPKIKLGELPKKDFEKISEWIKINKSTLLKYWNYKIDTETLIKNLKKLK